MSPLLLALRAVVVVTTVVSVSFACSALRSNRPRKAVWWTIVAAALTLGSLRFAQRANPSHERSTVAARAR